jgi:transposase
MLQQMGGQRCFARPPDARVVSGDEAGRDGFWLHRVLAAQDLENHGVASSRIGVTRRQRRAKTDRLDGHQVLTMRLRPRAGEKQVGRVVRGPRVEDEERRPLHRELRPAKRDRTRVTHRRQGLLASHGLRVARQGDVPAQLSQWRHGDGASRPPALRARLEREWQPGSFLTEELEGREAERRQRLHPSVEPVMEQIHPWPTRRGSGTNSVWLGVKEGFAWREFRHRKPVGAWAGLTPRPHQRGQSCHEGGSATAGNRHIRAMAIEMAWGWWRCQPERARSRW